MLYCPVKSLRAPQQPKVLRGTIEKLSIIAPPSECQATCFWCRKSLKSQETKKAPWFPKVLRLLCFIFSDRWRQSNQPIQSVIFLSYPNTPRRCFGLHEGVTSIDCLFITQGAIFLSNIADCICATASMGRVYFLCCVSSLSHIMSFRVIGAFGVGVYCNDAFVFVKSPDFRKEMNDDIDNCHNDSEFNKYQNDEKRKATEKEG